MDLLFAYHLDKLFLLFKPSETLALIIRQRYDTFPFCAKNFLVLFYYISSLFGFLYLLSKLVLVFHIHNIDNDHGLFQLLFDFVLVKTLCLLAVFRVSLQIKTKNTRYAKNLKHSLQTKMQHD